MIVAKKVDFKTYVDAAVRDEFARLIERKNITLTTAIESSLRWILKQDSLLQSLILGQIEDRDQREVLAMVVRRATGSELADVIAEDFGPPKPTAGKSRGPSGSARSG